MEYWFIKLDMISIFSSDGKIVVRENRLGVYVNQE